MRFSKLLVRNFRSIGPDGITVDFRRETNLCALVGANGSGKSNILDALAVVLGVYPFGSFEPESEDFHLCRSDDEVFIELELDPPLFDRDVYQKEYAIHGIRYRAWRKTRGTERGILETEHYCFGSDRKTLVKALRIKKGASGDEAVPIDNSYRPIAARKHAWKLGRAFYLDAPGLTRFFDRVAGRGPLGRLFELYRQDFDAEHNVYEYEGGRSMPSKGALRRYSDRLGDILRTDLLQKIETRLGQHVRSYFGGSPSDAFRIGMFPPSHREIFERWVTLGVRETAAAPPLPVERLGSGFQALMRLAVLETLVEFESDEVRLLLLIEEPEIYLHVHLRRHFARVLRRLAAAGHQIVFATHAPEFVDLAVAIEIVRVARSGSSTTEVRQVELATAATLARQAEKVRRMGNEEVFFARHAVLTEGQDDQAVVERLLEARMFDKDVHSVSIVNCDSKDQIPGYVELCQQLGIDFYVLHDEDDPERDASKNARVEAAAGKAAPTRPSYHRYRPSLEGVMKTEKRGRRNLDSLMALLDGKSYDDRRG